MADFAVFCLRLVDVTERRSQFEAIFTKMEEEQAAFTLEGDSLIDLIEVWLKTEKMEGTKVRFPNRGRYVTAKELHAELAALAEAREMKFAYQSGRSLGQRLRHIESNLRTVFQVEVDPNSSKNQKRYAFGPWRRGKCRTTCRNRNRPESTY